MLQILSRSEAIEKSLNRFYTGVPCKYGHLSERYTKDTHCIECKLQRSKNDYRRPGEKAKRSKYRKENRKLILAQERRTRARHPATASNKNSLYRIRKAGAGKFTNEELLFLRDSQTSCNGCGKEFNEKFPSTIDHKTPISLGGSNTIDNLQLLCRSCNSSKGGKPYDVWLNEKSCRDFSKST